MREFRRYLFGGAAIIAGLSDPAWASNTQDAGVSISNSSDRAGTKQAADDIVVTGTRVVRDGFNQPTPVTVAAVNDLVKATPTNLPDALNKLPQFSNSISPGANPNLQGNSGEHGNLLNLRGVGPSRALIMLDGIRVPPTTFRGAVDSNTIPQLLIQRVDVVTAGASAAYGSDAVSGVVNYILDDKFTGIKGVAQRGISTRGDLGSYRLGLAGGLEFAGGRGRIVLSGERYDNDGVIRSDRIYGDGGFATVGSVPGSTASAGSAANPYVYLGNLRILTNDFDGIISASTVPGLAGNKFVAGGSIRPVVTGIRTGSNQIFVGGDGQYLPGNNSLIAPLATTQGFGRLSYDFTDNLTAHVQGNYSRSVTSYDTQAQTVLGFTFYSGNAFLNPAVQARLGPTDSFTMFRFIAEQGPIHTREQTDAYLVNAGLKWTIGGWNVDLDYTHGTSITNFAQRQMEVPKLAAALDAVRAPDGSIVCRVTLTNPGLYPGCTPLNVFGSGTPTAEALATVLGVSRYRARNATDDATIVARGNLYELPAGPIALAVGAQYREQGLDLTSNSDPGIPLDLTGLRGVPANRRTRFNNTNIGPTFGRLNVKEAFAEIAIPLLKEQAFARELSINAAGRITDYSTSGRVTTWKVGAVWKPIADVMIRTTRSRDIRAPTLYDLFAGIQTAPVNYTDPHTNTSGTVRQASGGNASLRPEVADTFSAGLVLRPQFVPGLSLSIDYYDLKIKGAITTQGLNDVVNECEASAGTSPTCALIIRPLPFNNRSPSNYPITVNLITQNIAFLRTSGIDVDLSYRTTVGSGHLALRSYINYLDRFLSQNNSIAPVIDYAGHGINSQTPYARPKIKATFSIDYMLGGLNLFLQESIIGKIRPDPTQFYAERPIKPVFYTDATIGYKFKATRGEPELFVTATNLFDRKPPLVPAAAAPGLLYPTLFTVYDVAGRTATVGIRFRF